MIKLNIISLPKRYNISLYIGIFIFFLVLIFLRFWPWMPTVFSGDDLIAFLDYKAHHFASSIHQSLTLVYHLKYRPIWALTMLVLFSLFGKTVTAYLVINLLLQAISAILVYSIILRITRGNWVVAAVLAFVVATSRFACYQVTQIIGPLESLALIFFLLSFYGVIRAEESRQSAYAWSWFAIIAAFLAFNTHERYIVLVPWLMCTLFLLPTLRTLSLKQKFILLGVNLCGALFNFLYKVVLAHSVFFAGTAGTHLGINFSLIWTLAKEAVPSLFGFNHGPPYLTAIDILSLPRVYSWLAAIFTLLWLASILWGILVTKDEKLSIRSICQSLYWPILFLLLMLLLLTPPLLTIRLEQRWLIAPFIVVLFSFAWGITRLNQPRSQSLAAILAFLLGVISILLDVRIGRYFDALFFIQNARFATGVKQQIVDKDKDIHPKPALVLIADKSFCEWTLAGGDFFSFYEGAPRKIYCLNQMSDREKISLPENVEVYTVRFSNGIPIFSTSVVVE